MKCDVFNAILTFLLGVSVVLGVFFALRTIFHTHDLRALESQTAICQLNVARINGVLNAAGQYSKTHPDIEPIIKPFEPKPAAR